MGTETAKKEVGWVGVIRLLVIFEEPLKLNEAAVALPLTVAEFDMATPPLLNTSPWSPVSPVRE